MKKSELKSLIKECTKQVLSEGHPQYSGKKSLGKKSITISLPVKFELIENQYVDENGKKIENSGDYDIEYDRRALEKSIKAQIFAVVEKTIKDKITYSGGSSLIGFPNTMWTKKYQQVTGN